MPQRAPGEGGAGTTALADVLRAGDRVSKLRLLVEAGQVARDASLDLDSAPVIGVCFDKLGAFAAA